MGLKDEVVESTGESLRMKSSTAHPPAQLPLPPVTLAVKRKRSYVVEVPYMCLRKLRKRLYSVIDLTNQPMEY